MPGTIMDFFDGQEILVTGGTGYMGKALIEKLLRGIPTVKKIYVLVRPKKGKDPKQRFDEIYNSPLGLFTVLREKYPDRWKKVEVINGEVSTPDLGLSESDKTRVLNNVSILFHVAANVRFDISLKMAVKTNVGGTLNVVKLAKQMPRLRSFIHVSTSYCQANEEILEERRYSTLISPEGMLSIVDKVDDVVLESLTPKIIGNQPNTYGFSKALGEDIVARSGLPSAIARPSIVVACWKEPIPGWVDNLNGISSIVVGGGKGVLRTMIGRYDAPTHIIPCDNAINAIIALAWKVGSEKPKETIFMNITGDVSNPVYWKSLDENLRMQLNNYPLTNPFWYPGGDMTMSRLRHSFVLIVCQLLPACLFDTILYLARKKPFLIRIQSKVFVGVKLLEYYTMKEWRFQSDVMYALEMQLSPTDRELFFMSTKDVCWPDYFHNFTLGLKKYCLKEDPSSLPQALRAMKYYMFAHFFLKTIVGLCVVWFLYSWMTQLVITRQTLSQ